MRRSAKILSWTAAVLGGIILLAGIAVLAVQPYLNSPSVRRSLERSLSRQIGGNVTFRRIEVTLLPLPGLTFRDVDAEVPRQVKARIASVGIFPRLAPLLRGELLISRIRVHGADATVVLPQTLAATSPQKLSLNEVKSETEQVLASLVSAGPGLAFELEGGTMTVVVAGRKVLTVRNAGARIDLPPGPLLVDLHGSADPWGEFLLKGRFHIDDRAVTAEGLDIGLGHSQLSGLSARLDWGARPDLEVREGNASLDLGQLFSWAASSEALRPLLTDLRSLRGEVVLRSISARGPLSRRSNWRVVATGSVRDLALGAAWLPGPVSISRGEFSVASPAWSLSRVHASMLDSSIVLSGSLRGLLSNVSSAKAALSGTVGRDTMLWLFEKSGLPPRVLLRAPVRVKGLRVAWQRTGAVSVEGTAVMNDGATVKLDAVRKADDLDVRRLSVTDPDSSATLAARFSAKGRKLSFSGHLSQTTLHRIFANQRSGPGTVQGDLSVTMPADLQQRMEVQGTLDARAITVPWEGRPALEIDELSLHAEGHLIMVQKAAVTLGGSRYDLSGTVTSSGSRVTIDGSASADRIAVAELVEAIRGKKGAAPEEKKQEEEQTPVMIDGLMRVKAGEVDYDAYRFRNAQAQVSFEPGYVNLTFTRAEVCGLAVPSTLVYEKGKWQLDLTAGARGGDVAHMLSCLAGEKVAMSGTFDLVAALRSKDQGKGLLPQLEGQIDFSAHDGKIYRYPLLAKIFSVLSVTDLLRGKIPELGGSGFAYHTVRLKGSIEKGKLTLGQTMIDGSSLTVLAEGTVDLASRKADLVVLVAPFSSVNWVIRHIPLIGRLLGGTLISVPVKVTGDISDPKVVFLAPSAVGERIVKLLERIVELPVEIISPLLPEKKKEGN